MRTTVGGILYETNPIPHTRQESNVQKPRTEGRIPLSNFHPNAVNLVLGWCLLRILQARHGPEAARNSTPDEDETRETCEVEDAPEELQVNETQRVETTVAVGETSHPSSDRRYASSTANVKSSALGTLPATAARAVALRATDSAIAKVFKSAAFWAGSSKASLGEQLEATRRMSGKKTR